MLSAVENNSHLGSNRAYNVHHHLAYGNGGGVGPSPSITAGTGLNSYPTNVVPAMSAAEFVKPHPKLNRYSSLPSRNGGGGSTNGLPPSPVSSSISKFKYGAAAEQPVNLAMGSPSATSSPISSPQSAPPGMDKLSFAEFMYSRHAAATAAGFLAPQNYPPLMYPPPPGASTNGLSFGAPQSIKQGKGGDHGPPSMSPPVVAGDRGGGVHLSTEAMMNSHRYQQQQQQQQYHQQMHQQQQQQQKGLKGSNGTGFMMPPAPSMMPTQAELEAFHAYHEMGSRLYYNGHGGPPPPPTEHMINGQRLHNGQQQQQQSPSPQPSSAMPSRSQPQHPQSKRAILEQGMYPQQQQQPHYSNHRPQLTGGGGKGAHQSPQDKNNNIGFKVPSGKEGAIKHRPSTAKSRGKGKQQSAKGAINSNSNSSYGTSNIVKSNFNKGVLIELGNGELKPVEEMRTEDFILSSNVTPDLELIDSTILRIMPHGNVIVLTLSNSASKLNIDLTVAPEHPFFVYRQGWASCNPEGTHQMHGLKCQRLDVGDVCISLMQRERPERSDAIEENGGIARINSGSSSSSSTSSSLSSPPPAQSQQHQLLQQHQQSQPQQDEPQNLSRKPPPMKESRGSIEGTTHHPSLHSSSSSSSTQSSCTAISSTTIAKGVGGRGDTSLYPTSVADIPQPLHALVHHPLPHEHPQHSSSLFRNGHAPTPQHQSQPSQQTPGANPLMNSFLSNFKHNYLAAFEAAKAAASLNEKMGGAGNGLSHSIKNIVMGDNSSYGPATEGAKYPSRQYSPNGGSPGMNSTSSSLSSPNGSNGSKRRYSAPDNVFAEADVGVRMGQSSSREGRLDYEEPPKKMASH